MTFEWDDAKNRANIAKHGLSFEDAIRVFDGPTYDVDDLSDPVGEIRTRSYGYLGLQTIALIVHTDRNHVTRIISARYANRNEKTRFEAALRQALDARRGE